MSLHNTWRSYRSLETVLCLNYKHVATPALSWSVLARAIPF